MGEKKPFLLRLDAQLHQALQHWADDELRSLNAQMEYALRLALKKAGRWPDSNEKEGKQKPNG